MLPVLVDNSYKEALAMGYMGFGMRKEVYSRKPKEAFAQLKRNERSKPKLSSKGIRKSKTPKQSIVKPEGKWQVVLHYAKVLATLGLLVWVALMILSEIGVFDGR